VWISLLVTAGCTGEDPRGRSSEPIGLPAKRRSTSQRRVAARPWRSWKTQGSAVGADSSAPIVGLNADPTPLRSAVCTGSVAAVRKLVEAGASVHVKDGPYMATPLEWADYFLRESGAGKFDYFQRKGPRPRQHAEMASSPRGIDSEGSRLVDR
jgi:hypothetical protein